MNAHAAPATTPTRVRMLAPLLALCVTLGAPAVARADGGAELGSVELGIDTSLIGGDGLGGRLGLRAGVVVGEWWHLEGSVAHGVTGDLELTTGMLHAHYGAFDDEEGLYLLFGAGHARVVDSSEPGGEESGPVAEIGFGTSASLWDEGRTTFRFELKVAHVDALDGVTVPSATLGFGWRLPSAKKVRP